MAANFCYPMAAGFFFAPQAPSPSSGVTVKPRHPNGSKKSYKLENAFLKSPKSIPPPVRLVYSISIRNHTKRRNTFEDRAMAEKGGIGGEE